MVIPGEWYMGVSLLMDILCLTLAQRLQGCRARPGRILLSACVGTGLSMGTLALWGLRAGVFAALPIGLLMALLAFGPRACGQGTAGLLLMGLMAAALAGYLHRLGAHMWAAGLACAPAVWFSGRLLLRWRSRAGERAELRLLFEGGGVTLDGMVDTGNLLRDPVTALPVVVASYAALQRHLPRGMRCEDVSTLPRGFRLISVQTAGGSRLLMCFRPRGLYIRSGRVWHAVQATVAVSPSLSGRRALLPPGVMEHVQ